MIQEFQGKVIKAAQALQQQLAESAEKPALDGWKTDRADVQNDTAADADLVLALGASSSSGSRELAAVTASSSSSGSAERPAERPAASKQLSITTIHGIQRWLAEDHVASCTSADAQRIREAVAVLSRPNPRQDDIRPLQKKWQVGQKTKHRDRCRM